MKSLKSDLWNAITKCRSEFHSKGWEYYGDVGVRLSYPLRLLELAKSYLGERNSKVLDVGCGWGALTVALSYLSPKYEVYGIDDHCDETTRDFSQRIQSYFMTRIKFGIHNIYNPLPFEDNNLNMVIFTDVIEHVLPIKPILEEINRVLKRDGLILLSTPNSVRFSKRIPILLGATPSSSSLRDFYYNIPFRGHLREFTMKEMSIVLNFAGFDILHREFCLYSKYPYPFKARSLRTFVGSVIDFVCTLASYILRSGKDSIIIVGRKR